MMSERSAEQQCELASDICDLLAKHELSHHEGIFEVSQTLLLMLMYEGASKQAVLRMISAMWDYLEEHMDESEVAGHA